ncbi:hypothetical protein EOD23_32210 [Mesorhizobium sp. USDA-HM6]|nr:hypothetical protein EOD23_32210 [Mesorhizobium sp. USDA-HM6]
MADKCGNETAIEISALPARKIEHVSAPIASNLQALSNAGRSRRLGLQAKLPAACLEILVLSSEARRNCQEDDRCRNEAPGC